MLKATARVRLRRAADAKLAKKDMLFVYVRGATSINTWKYKRPVRVRLVVAGHLG
jgi:hypothetical protein